MISFTTHMLGNKDLSEKTENHFNPSEHFADELEIEVLQCSYFEPEKCP